MTAVAPPPAHVASTRGEILRVYRTLRAAQGEGDEHTFLAPDWFQTCSGGVPQGNDGHETPATDADSLRHLIAHDPDPATVALAMRWLPALPHRPEDVEWLEGWFHDDRPGFSQPRLRQDGQPLGPAPSYLEWETLTVGQAAVEAASVIASGRCTQDASELRAYLERAGPLEETPEFWRSAIGVDEAARSRLRERDSELYLRVAMFYVPDLPNDPSYLPLFRARVPEARLIRMWRGDGDWPELIAHPFPHDFASWTLDHADALLADADETLRRLFDEGLFADSPQARGILARAAAARLQDPAPVLRRVLAERPDDWLLHRDVARDHPVRVADELIARVHAGEAYEDHRVRGSILDGLREAGPRARPTILRLAADAPHLDPEQMRALVRTAQAVGLPVSEDCLERVEVGIDYDGRDEPPPGWDAAVRRANRRQERRTRRCLAELRAAGREAMSAAL
ncbi:MAG: hypothetical protein KF729_24565 [Sandaracinaceae bacterium]|nr:hypothetical protein [Sandaracinaceae bacterium]